jgi:hypothetical protein
VRALFLSLRYWGTKAIFFTALAATFGVVLLLASGIMLLEELRTKRITVAAKVIEKGKDVNRAPAPVPDGRGKMKAPDPNVYWLKYSFQDAQGRTFSSKENVDQDRWNQSENGSPVSVWYVEGQPENSQPVHSGGYAWLAPAVFMGVSLVILGIVAAVVVGAWKEMLPRVRLVLRGTPVLARVNQVLAKETPSAAKGSPPVVRHHLQYLFYDTGSQIITGESAALPTKLKDRWHIEDIILVLFNQDNPSENELDIYGVRNDDFERLKKEMGD